MTTLNTANGTPVAPWSFGTMQFGGTADEKDSAAMFHACRASGLSHFDTAWAYTDGRSEEILGRLVADAPQDVFVATKVAYVGGASKENITTQFDTSRRRLGMDRVDLLYLHRYDPDTDLNETLHTLAAMQAKGLIRYIGLSNFAAWQVMKAQAVAQELGTKIDVIQPMYNLVKRQAEVELLPMCIDQGIVACTYSPLGGGLLTGKYEVGGTGRLDTDERYAARYGQVAMKNAARGLNEVAERAGVHPATLAAAWVASHAARPHPILSARNLDQLRPSLAAVNFNLNEALYDEISALMPAPPPATDRIEEA